MSDLIARWKYFLRGDREPTTEVPTDLIEQTIAALSPVLPEDVQRAVTALEDYDDLSWEIRHRICDLIERLTRETTYNRNVMEAETMRANKAERRAELAERQRDEYRKMVVEWQRDAADCDEWVLHDDIQRDLDRIRAMSEHSP